VQYLLNNGWTPCIEFESADKAYADTHGWSGIDSAVNAGYYDNRYWVMWKLPMYGCTSPDEVLQEIRACTRAFPECFIRVAGFDNIKQVQCSSFLAHRPSNDGTFQPVNGRQVGDGGAAPPQQGGGYSAPPPPPPSNDNHTGAGGQYTGGSW
jgi:ribulose-bisphosphate carboxylase small chain